MGQIMGWRLLRKYVRSRGEARTPNRKAPNRWGGQTDFFYKCFAIANGWVSVSPEMFSCWCYSGSELSSDDAEGWPVWRYIFARPDAWCSKVSFKHYVNASVDSQATATDLIYKWTVTVTVDTEQHRRQAGLHRASTNKPTEHPTHTWQSQSTNPAISV